LPVFDLAYAIQVLSRVLHLLSAMIMVGGLFYMRTVLAPSATTGAATTRTATTGTTIGEACFADRRSVWARWVGMTTFFLLASGIYNLLTIIGQSKATGVKLPATYHMLLGIKFLLALLVMFVMSILAGKTTIADKFRGQMQKWLNLAWLAAIAIVVIAGVMRTLH
jgi:uncharacterized membrane protein